MKRTYVVLGASGNTGGQIAQQLLASGQHVIAVGRNAASLNALAAKGAEIATGDILDSAFLEGLFRRADAAYLLIPPNLSAPDFLAYGNAAGESIAGAVQRSGLKYAVNLSSMLADRPSGTGPIVSVHRQEKRLNQIPGLNVLHLRPAYFLENLFMFVPMVQHMGITGGMVNPDVRFPMIATADIGAAAAQHLLALDFSGNRVRDLLGAAEYSFGEFTQQLGQLIGKPDLQYHVFDAPSQKQGMVQAGLGESIADLYLEMNATLNDPAVDFAFRTAANTTPTSLAQFLPALAGAIKAGQPA